MIMLLSCSTKGYHLIAPLSTAAKNLRWLWTPPTYIFLNFAKIVPYHAYQNVDNKKKIHMPLAGHTVAMKPTAQPLVNMLSLLQHNRLP